MTIEVWRIHIPTQPPAYWRQTLTAAETARADRFHHETDRNRFTVTRGILRHLLAAPPQAEFHQNPWGKPYLPDTNLHFNVSHSGDYALIALARDIEIGVDIEHMIRPRPFNDLARRVFTPQEREHFESLPDQARTNFFYRLWTCKEAVMKADGRGLNIPPDRIEIAFDQTGRPALKSSQELHPPWAIQIIQVTPDYAAAIAIPSNSTQLAVRDWTNRP
jgi:4'-phosphopantetheinyl transferase